LAICHAFELKVNILFSRKGFEELFQDSVSLILGLLPLVVLGLDRGSDEAVVVGVSFLKFNIFAKAY